MIDKIYGFLLGIFIAISFLLLGKSIERIEGKIDKNIIEIKIEERIETLKELNYSQEETYKNIIQKYKVDEKFIKSLYLKGAE